MKAVIIPGFVVMAAITLAASAAYLPLLPHAWRNRRQGSDDPRFDLLLAIIMFTCAQALLLTWFAVVVVLRDLNIPFSRVTDHWASLPMILGVCVGAGFFIRGATREVLSASQCWSVVIGGALGLWVLVYGMLPG